MSLAEPTLSTSPSSQPSPDCVCFVSDNQTHDMVERVLKHYFPDPMIRDGGSSSALQLLSEGAPPKLLIVDVSDADDPFNAMVSLATALTDETFIIGLGAINDIGLYRELIDAGIADYLVKPITERALADSLARLEEASAGEAGDFDDQTNHIAVIGARGGVGASTLATNLAWHMAETQEEKTALVDLDLEFGTVALSLDLEPTRGLREALENPARIDSLFVSSAMAKVTDRLSVMATEETMVGAHHSNPDAVDILISALDRDFANLVFDVPRPALGLRQQVLQAATHVVLVTDISLAGLRDSIRLLGAIEEAAPGVPVTVVANHINPKSGQMPVGDFQKALGHKVDVRISEDPKAFQQATSQGKPLLDVTPKGAAAKAVRGIAREITGAKERKDGQARGLIGALRGLLKGKPIK